MTSGIEWKNYYEEGEEDLEDWLSDTEIDQDPPAEKPVDTSFPNTIFIANVPKVDAAKYDKLHSVLQTKLFNKVGPNETWMPINKDTGSTDGFIVVTYETREAAVEAREKFNNLELDKKHTFKAFLMDDFDGITQYDEKEPTSDSVNVTTTDLEDLRDWMEDSGQREQFVCRYDVGENEIFWHNPVTTQPELEYGGEREKKGGKVWCDNKVQWSPRGSYLTTFHLPGIALWGGDKFTKRSRFQHRDVKHVEFSPNEEYLLTWNGLHPAEKDQTSVRIWRIFTNEMVASFPTPSFTARGGEFPHFLWSPDSRFLARCTDSAIFLYDAQDNFQLAMDPATEKRGPIKFPDGLQGFDWCPNDNILSAWIPEKNNIPARLQLIRIPSRRELAAKNLFSVRDATMHWHPGGKYLCVNAMRMSRSKKTGHTQLEIFRITEKNVPVETVEIKDSVKSFHWEPNGDRFCVLTTDENGQQLKAKFFAISDRDCQEVAKYDLHSGVSHVHWAPAGQYFCMAAIPGGDMIFGQIDSNNKLDILHKDEHFLLTEILWDPSSRYIMSAVTQQMGAGIRYQTEAGYKMWSFQGRLLYQFNKEKLFQINWRPHPPSLLDAKMIDDVKNNLKAYSKKYDQADDQQKESAKVAGQKQRAHDIGKWDHIMEKLQKYKESKWEPTGWKDAFDALNGLSTWEEITETIEEEIEVKEEIITD